MKQNRYSLVIYGATGFTGQLICDYIHSHYEFNSLPWAVAGRNQTKLKKLSRRYGVDYLVADSFENFTFCSL